MTATCAATPAYAIDPGCYPADVVRNATWLANGPEKQATIIVGERNSDTHNKNFFTSNADGSVGYNIEGDGRVNDGESGKLCIAAKYTNVRVNIEPNRPSWVTAPEGSRNDRYLTVQEKRDQVRVIFGASTVVRGLNKQEYVGPQLLVTKADVPIDGLITGAVITNDRQGNGDGLFAMVNLRTNANFDALVRAQNRVQTASISYGMK